MNFKTLKQSQRSKKLKDLANLNKKFVNNLENENFSDAEYSVLGRGLKFIDVLKNPRAHLLDVDTESFRRKMRIRYLMANKKSKRINRFKPPSSWHPLSLFSVDLEN